MIRQPEARNGFGLFQLVYEHTRNDSGSGNVVLLLCKQADSPLINGGQEAACHQMQKSAAGRLRIVAKKERKNEKVVT